MLNRRGCVQGYWGHFATTNFAEEKGAGQVPCVNVAREVLDIERLFHLALPRFRRVGDLRHMGLDEVTIGLGLLHLTLRLKIGGVVVFWVNER